MPNKYELFTQMAEDTARRITGSLQGWTAFLNTAARLYKYPYHEQLMIFAQRPEATACAEYDLWNNQMRRFVRRGAKGIGLLETSGDNPKIRYVFDVADTGGGEHSRRPFLWEYKPEHFDAVSAALEQRFAVSGENGITDQMERIATQLAEEYWNDFRHDILDIVDDSFLEGYDEYNIGVAFRNAATVSTTYVLLSRCGLSPEDYFVHEDFLNVFDFNTPATVAALGTAVSQSSEQVLRQIEATIKNYEREKLAERSRNDLHEERRLPDPGSDPARTGAAAPRQVRTDAEELPEGASPGAVEQSDSQREAVPPLEGDRRSGDAPDGADDAGTGSGGKRDGGAESQRPDALDGADEQLQGTGGGNRPERAGVRLTPQVPAADLPMEQLTLFPSEDEQIQMIQEAESVTDAPSAFSFSQADIDAALCRGSGFAGGKLRVYGFYQHGPDSRAAIAFLKEEYGYFGHSHTFLGVSSGFVTYSAKGMNLQHYAPNYEKMLKWNAVERRLRQLITEKRYLTDAEQAQYAEIEQDYAGTGGVPLPQARLGFPKPEGQTSEVPSIMEDYFALKEAHPDGIVLYQVTDFFVMHGKDARIAAEILHIPSAIQDFTGMGRVTTSAFPTDRLTEYVEQLRDKYDVTISEISDNGKRRVYSMPSIDHEAEAALNRHEAEFGADGTRAFRETLPAEEPPKLPSNIKPTQADIDDALRTWNGDIASKRTVVRYMKDHAREKGTAAWLAREYGGDPSLPLRISLAGSDQVVVLPWSKVQRRIAQLIEADNFYTDAEQDNLDDIDPTAVREALAERGIVNGEVVDPTALDRDPFIQQVVSDVKQIAQEETVPQEELEPQNSGTNAPELDAEETETDTFPSEVDAAYYMGDTVGDAPSEPQQAQNFRITDDHLGEGGAKTKFRRNMDAIKLLKELELEGRQASPEEQEILSRYVGWGGLADAFDESKPNWASEFQELYASLSPEEYEAARSSTLNAHYTSPTVIKAIYEAVSNMGFKAGNILEPSMGVGNFFGLLPEEIQKSRLYGVELDSITGRIAKQLYPNADITVAGFETTDRRDFFDLAVGNVPFGQYQVNDRAYNKLGFSIHDYFFAKTLDQVRPGGVIAFVTSRYTMDKQSSEVRKYIAQRAELLGAIRLPNNAFRANAGTDVVSDIIFLQKRETPIDIEPDWVHLGQNGDGFAINSYFMEHPEMILGRQTSESTQYGKQDFTVVPIEGASLAGQLHEAVQHIRGTYQEAELPDLGEGEEIRDSLPADPDVKNYSFTVVDGEVYYRENSIMVRPDLNATAKERVKGMVALRDCVHELIDLQMDEYTPDAEIQAKQAELNALYDAFSAKYGLINDRGNRLAFSDDSSYYLLCSLEVLDDDGKLERKADMFTKRTIKQQRKVDHVDTAVEALAVSIGERARVDLPFMSQLCSKSVEEVISELRGIIFKDPSYGDDPLSCWQTADEYLSGNVRQKLRAAQRAAEKDSAFQINVDALKRAQPKDLDASEIEVRLGATWIDKKYIQQFMEETFRIPFYLRRKIQVNYSPYTAEWQITGKTVVGRGDVAAYNIYGTDRANAYRLLEDALNLRDIRIYDTVEDADGKERRVLNARETTLAAQKQQMIRDAFKDWIWRDPERRQALVRQYNEEMNSIRPREYDGSHIVFSGMNPEITLREHQRNAIAHVLYGGNTLLAHEVGAGKTFEMVAAAMESKRLGLCNKSIFVVPNHLTEQWASEFLRLYPSAKILVTTKKDFQTHNRKKFCARIATGDYDAVIIGHSQFEKIPISAERQARLLREQIRDITDGIDEMERSGAERFTIKQLERTKKSLQARLEKLQASDRKDDVVTFEQIGVDRMFVDESDNYKNLFLYTKMRNVAGLATTDAQKSSDMFAKCRYLDELTGGRGVVFATGTPISNSMTEMYTIQRYLQYDRLQEMGMGHFDCWASRFGETTTALELAPEGTGYRARTRFAKFFNLPELMSLFKEVADIKTADQLHLPTPEVEYHTYASKPTGIQQEMVKALSERATKVHSGTVDARVDNMLKITSDGRKLGLDQRIIDAMLPDEDGTKVNQCVRNILQYWREGDAAKLTQLVFCDISTPRGRSAPDKIAAKAAGGRLGSPEIHALETAIPLDEERETPFTIYEDIRQKLIAGGMPAEQIAFIHDADTDVRKKELFGKVRSGQVRVLIGSTAKMGAGTNVQDRLIASHDLDCRATRS